MNMPIDLHVYEALTEIGVKPESARKVERALEASLGQVEDRVLSSVKDTMFTKTDGEAIRGEIAALRGEIYKSMNDLTLRLIAAQFAGMGLLFAALKLFN